MSCDDLDILKARQDEDDYNSNFGLESINEYEADDIAENAHQMPGKRRCKKCKQLYCC